MKKLVLVDSDKCSGGIRELDHCCMPLINSMFIELECDEAGKVISNADNQKLIDVAFKRAIIRAHAHVEER